MSLLIVTCKYVGCSRDKPYRNYHCNLLRYGVGGISIYQSCHENRVRSPGCDVAFTRMDWMIHRYMSVLLVVSVTNKQTKPSAISSVSRLFYVFDLRYFYRKVNRYKINPPWKLIKGDKMLLLSSFRILRYTKSITDISLKVNSFSNLITKLLTKIKSFKEIRTERYLLCKDSGLTLLLSAIYIESIYINKQTAKLRISRPHNVRNSPVIQPLRGLGSRYEVLKVRDVRLYIEVGACPHALFCLFWWCFVTLSYKITTPPIPP